MAKSTLPNVQLHPTRRFVVPNDRDAKTLFKLPADCWSEYLNDPSGFGIVEMKATKKRGKIRTPVKVKLSPRLIETDPKVTEVLSQFDSDVTNVCISEWEAGNRYVTYSTIYRTLTGKVGDSDSNPSKDQLAAIKLSLKKLMNIEIEFFFYDACEKLGYNEGKKKHIKDKIIPARFIEGTVNGQRTTVIELTAESPLIQIARIKNNQILSYNVELLNVPNQKNTPLNIELKHYALRRVLEIKGHPKQMFPAITFEDVLTKCRIANADNKKKHRVREFLKSFFEHLIDNDVIDSFQVNKKAGVFHSISFTFSTAKKAEKKPKTKEKPKTSQSSSEMKESESKVQSADTHPNLALAMEISQYWKYRHYPMAITPWNTDITAILRFIKTHAFSLL